jgi:PKD repeat protein
VVAPTPKPNFSVNNSICVGDIVIFENLSTIHSGFMTYKWYFGDGDTSDLNTPNHTYTSSGVKSVRLIATNDLWKVTKDTTINISVGELPNIAFTPINACEGQDIRFNNNTTISFGALNYTWNFGDGSPAVNTSNNNPVFKRYSNSGGYKVTLTAESAGCINTLTKTAYQFAKPNPNFELVSGSCSNKPFQFVNTSNIKFGSFGNKWDFSDNTSITSDSLKTFKTFIYDKSLGEVLRFYDHIAITDHNCKDTAVYAVKVWPKPSVNFTLSTPDTLKCLPSARWTFSSTTFVETDSFDLKWNFGNGSKSTAHTIKNFRYNSIGKYKVKLLAISPYGCNDSITKSIEVIPVPKAGFYTPDSAKCLKGNLFTLIDSSKGQYLSYSWSLDENQSDTGKRFRAELHSKKRDGFTSWFGGEEQANRCCWNH